MDIAEIERQPRVEKVKFAEGMLAVDIKDGRVILVPLTWYPRLLEATEAERANWLVFEDTDERDIIFWEEVDELIPVVALLTGIPSQESAQSFQNWLAERTPS